MTDINLVLAEELERLAAEYRAKAKNHTINDQISIQDISIVLTRK